jgi:hypothetical protein
MSKKRMRAISGFFLTSGRDGLLSARRLERSSCPSFPDARFCRACIGSVVPGVFLAGDHAQGAFCQNHEDDTDCSEVVQNQRSSVVRFQVHQLRARSQSGSFHGARFSLRSIWMLSWTLSPLERIQRKKARTPRTA